MTPLGSPIEISAGDKPIRLNEKIKITMAYDPVMVPKDIEVKKIRVLYYDGASWESLRPVSVDLEKSQVVFESYHFSVFGLNQVGDETKITENWIKSAAFDKTLRKGLNKKSDYITNQIIDMTLKKLGISDESTKGKILADILKDDGYADVVKAYANGDIVDGGQKVAALCGSKIVELVPKSVLSKALNSVAGSSGDIAAAGKALGNIEAGQYRDAAKIIGEQIADKFLIVTAGKIAVQVVGAQIESWKNAEVEAAFQAYKNGANGAFWGYNVDKKDFDAVWIQMKGASRQLEIEAIAKENEIRKEAGMPALTEKEEESVRATVKESYRTQFATRIEKDAEIKKEEKNLRTMVEAFKKADFFTGALAPAGLDKGLDYENTLDVLSHFMNKMMNDTNRFELSTKEGLIMDKAISISDIVQGARIYFSLPDGKKKYGEYLKDRFGIKPRPKLSDVKPQQGIATAMIPVADSFTGKILGEAYGQISFWNVGQLSGDPIYAKAILSGDCSKSTTPGCGVGAPVEGIFSGGPNGVITLDGGFTYTLKDGKYFELIFGGKTYKYTVENPDIFSNWP